jgi:hypothetical protein
MRRNRVKGAAAVAIDQARTQMPLRGVLRFLGISARRVQAWRRREHAFTLGDRSSCPRPSPQRFTQAEVHAIGDMATAKGLSACADRTAGAARAAARHRVRVALDLVEPRAAPSVWRRPRSRVHPKSPSLGVRAARPDELWHIDTTVIRLHDARRAFLHAVSDNYSRCILAWRVADRRRRPIAWRCSWRRVGRLSYRTARRTCWPMLASRTSTRRSMHWCRPALSAACCRSPSARTPTR